MAHEILGDLVVSRTVDSKRTNQTLNAETITGPRAVIKHDFAWLSLNGGAANRTVTLPDATTLSAGWQVVVQNSGATNSLAVVDNAAGALKTIAAPAAVNDTSAYAFVCTDISTVAGVWYVIELGDATVQATKYVASFALGDFVALGAEYMEITSVEVAGLGAATHGKGITPVSILQKGAAAPFKKVTADEESFDASGNMTVVVTNGAEFDGRVIFV